jgi:ABC-2 type transport system ATP-binding protein
MNNPPDSGNDGAAITIIRTEKHEEDSLTGRTALIETKGLSVYYGRRCGVHGLDLSVEQGEVYGFLGPNGAGKTTTLRVLLDIIRPTAGTASVFGLDCQKEGVRLRRRVGYIPGELSLPPRLRADAYFRMIHAVRGNTGHAADTAGLCDRLKLDPSRPMRTYSRGNKQKVGLVAAFMGKPDLLILDEPTGGLDPIIQQNVLALVREARADGRTVFFSSHLLSEVQEVCDRVGIVREGQMVAVERVETLVRGQFHRLRLRLERMAPPGAFDLDGVREVGRTGRSVTLEIRQNLNQVLSRAVSYGVLDLEDRPFSLEEVFLAYYDKSADGRHE